MIIEISENVRRENTKSNYILSFLYDAVQWSSFAKELSHIYVWAH